MKQISKRTKMVMMVMLMSMAMPLMVNSQPPAPDSDDIDTPIDGGISLVLAAGGALGIKMLRSKKKRSFDNK